jgi:F0F1-type ATP synthase membrane subunit a
VVYLYFFFVLLGHFYFGKIVCFLSWFLGGVYFKAGVGGWGGWLFYVLFIIIFLSCFFGFLRYSESVFSIFLFTFLFSFCSWLVSFIYFLSYINFFIYLRKLGDSFYLAFFLIIIEVVREFSRPLSLRVRLLVNVRVGHALGLAGFFIYEFYLGLFFYTLVLIPIENIVFLIQRYIFSRLIYMYLGDTSFKIG